jgi:nicotinamide mononucleotide transporter
MQVNASIINILEWVSALLGLLSVVGNIKLKRGAWPLQAVSSLGYCVVFYHQDLRGLALLQIYFAGFALWAFSHWKSNALVNSQRVKNLASAQLGVVLFSWLIATFLIGWFLAKTGEGATGYIDAFTVVGSVLAQWLMARYYANTWAIWLTVNSVSVALFAYSKLWPTAALYLIFTALAVAGMRAWKK